MVKCLKTVLLSLGILASAGGCVNQTYKTDGCGPDTDQGLEVSFYSRTRCQNTAVYPEDVDNILVCVFDDEGILKRHLYLDGVRPDAEYFVEIPTAPGLYTVSAWAGLEGDYFETYTPVDGRTSRDDLAFSINRTEETAAGLEGVKVYQGESRAVYVESAKDRDAYKHVEVNLLEATNRISISVEGLPTNARDYEITIEADNGSMTYAGDIADDAILVYRPVFTYGDGTVEGDFTLLKLETGHNYYIAVRNVVSGTELYHGSLLGALILKNPTVDLLCDHDFTIRFTAEDQCDCGTYAITEIWVNNWLVHSYGTEL